MIIRNYLIKLGVAELFFEWAGKQLEIWTHLRKIALKFHDMTIFLQNAWKHLAPSPQFIDNFQFFKKFVEFTDQIERRELGIPQDFVDLFYEYSC